MTDLSPLIQQVQATEYSHVVVFLEDDGIRWRAQTKEACRDMAEILEDYDARVLTRQDFLDILIDIQGVQ